MARRRNNGLSAFFDGFNQGYDTVNRVSRDFETQDIMKEDVTETQNYSPEEVKQIEANVAAGKENPYEGVGMSGTKFTYNGKSFDAKPSDVQLDGLRAARLADVAQKHGDHSGAMALRRDARRAKEEDRAAQIRDAVDAERKRYQDMLKDPRKYALEAYKANEGIGGMGDHKDRSIDVVDMPNGMLRITQFDKDNNPLGYVDKKAEELDAIAKDFLFKNHVMNLASIDGDRWNTLAYQMGKDDKHVRMMLDDRERQQSNWEKTHQAGRDDAKATADYRSRHLDLQEKELSERRSARVDGKTQMVTGYDRTTNEPVIFGAKIRDGRIELPGNVTLNKPVDNTDKRLDRLTKERKAIEDEYTWLDKNKRGGDLFKFGDNDPENQDNARLLELRNRLQAIDSELTQINVAPNLPKRDSASTKQTPSQQETKQAQEIVKPSLGDARVTWSAAKGINPSVLAMRLRELESKARDSEDPEGYLAQNNYAAIKHQYDQMTSR